MGRSARDCAIGPDEPMKDLTQGSVTRNLLHLSGFLAVSMLFQTLYLLIDLFWVGRLGKEAIAAVGLAGNIMLVVLALTQALGVGTTTLISHAAGRKDQSRARLVFNQSLVLSMVCGLVFGIVAFALRGAYCRALAADALTVRLAREYLLWFLPALTTQFGLVAMGSALRGTGIVMPTVVIQVATVALNIVLAPVLIFGWGTAHPLGVAGASLATLISVAVGVLLLVVYFLRAEGYIQFERTQWKPDWSIWRGMLAVGAPAGGDFILISVYLALVYWVIRDFGAAAQAGFGIGGRVMQSLFLPVMAVAFAASPVAGQNFGARAGDRVRQTFSSAAILSSAFMLLLTFGCQIAPEALIRVFSRDAKVIAFGAEYLRIISWNFVPSGIIFVSASIFQGIGNTAPPLASSCVRLLIFALPAYLLSRSQGFEIREIWYLSLATVLVQAVVNVALLLREFRRKLAFTVLDPPEGAGEGGLGAVGRGAARS
jgi:putative MATE family efflux protein